MLINAVFCKLELKYANRLLRCLNLFFSLRTASRLSKDRLIDVLKPFDNSETQFCWVYYQSLLAKVLKLLVNYASNIDSRFLYFTQNHKFENIASLGDYSWVRKWLSIPMSPKTLLLVSIQTTSFGTYTSFISPLC